MHDIVIYHLTTVLSVKIAHVRKTRQIHGGLVFIYKHKRISELSNNSKINWYLKIKLTKIHIEQHWLSETVKLQEKMLVIPVGMPVQLCPTLKDAKIDSCLKATVY